MRIANTVEDSIVDGPGLRFTVFAQGCNHHCPGCHNPETHDPAGGQEVSLDELTSMLTNNPRTEGLTLSGGEPFLQAKDCAHLAETAHRLGLNVWTFTGYRYETILQENREDWNALLSQTDVLVDGPYLEQERSLLLLFRGSRNQRLIDVPKSESLGRVVLWERKDKLTQFTVPES